MSYTFIECSEEREFQYDSNFNIIEQYMASNNDVCFPFVVAASIQGGISGKLYDKNKDNFKFHFEHNKTEDESQAAVTINPYNNLEVCVHQDVFKDSDCFYLLLEVLHQDGDYFNRPIIFGRSQLISVTDYALTIEERFKDSQYVTRLHGFDFAWYNKCGGENSGLDVMIAIKDEKGQIINATTILPITTSLVYSDGSPTPFMPLSPLKERKNSTSSRKTLYRPLRPEPILGPDVSMVPFSFRIEEVSFHHPGHSGFKLKVSCSRNCKKIVHPGILGETIVVLSKPKHETKVESSNCFFAPGTAIKKANLNNNKLVVMIPSDKLLNGLITENGACHSCGRKIERKDFLSVGSHHDSCRFVLNVLPFINCASNSIKGKTRGGRRGRKVRSLTEETKVNKDHKMISSIEKEIAQNETKRPRLTYDECIQKDTQLSIIAQNKVVSVEEQGLISKEVERKDNHTKYFIDTLDVSPIRLQRSNILVSKQSDKHHQNIQESIFMDMNDKFKKLEPNHNGDHDEYPNLSHQLPVVSSNFDPIPLKISSSTCEDFDDAVGDVRDFVDGSNQSSSNILTDFDPISYKNCGTQNLSAITPLSDPHLIGPLEAAKKVSVSVTFDEPLLPSMALPFYFPEPGSGFETI